MTHFPDQPHDGQQVVDELQEPPGYIRVWTYNEAKNEWTYKEYGPGGGGVVYTDQVLVRDNTEVPGMALADPSELKTQKEVNYWLDEKAGQGGGEPNLGKESKPWLEISKYGMRTSRTGWGQGFVYEVTWSCNPNCTFSWQHEIDINGDGNWIDIAAHPQKDELGFEQASETPVSVVLVQGDQASKFPNALMRFRLAGELNGILSELSSGAIAAWEERTEEYDPPMYEDGTAVDLEPYATTEYVDEKVEEYDDRYLQLNEPNNVNNQFRIKGTGGTYISTAGDELGIYHLKTPTDVTHAANKGYVDEQIAAIEIPDGELSIADKLYLQGFYPFKIAEGTQVENAGEMTVKKDNYLVDLDPETWKYFSFSVVDAYGLDLAAKSLNHMHMDNYYFAQIWFLREDGRKLCSYIAEMKAKDNNFEQKFDLEMKNGKEFITSKSWDLPSLRVDKGEVLWVKCSFWGN